MLMIGYFVGICDQQKYENNIASFEVDWRTVVVQSWLNT